MLRLTTQATFFTCLVLSLWLGIYVVSRNPRRTIAWLTALTLWSVSGLSINVLLALNPPPTPAYFPTWLRLLLPFWSANVLNGPGNHWLQGWSVTFAVAFWHHATMLMRPGPLNSWRWTRILAIYVLAVAAIIVQALTPFMFESVQGDPLYINTLHAGGLYIFFMAGLLAYTIFSLINLLRTAHATPLFLPRRQLHTLAVATLIAGLTGPAGIAGSALGLPVPMFVLGVLLSVATGLIGYGVANYSALMQDGRTIRRDFNYNLIAVGLITLVYLGAGWASVEVFGVPPTIFILFLLVAVVTHALIDAGRSSLDAVIYQSGTRHLRAELRRLSRQAGQQDELDTSLALALDTLCTSIKATSGLILLFEGKTLQTAATVRSPASQLHLLPKDLAADDVTPLELGHFQTPLETIALLIPLYSETEQIGAILFGHPENGVRYSQSDIESLLYPTDQLAEAIVHARRQQHKLQEVAALLEGPKEPPRAPSPSVSVKEVEDALRGLFDFSYLGNHPLARMKWVRQGTPAGKVTHLDRGKVVYDLLVQAIDKLKPESGPPSDPPPREWYPYLILHEAYVEDKANRDIMARLYISEGTFNRTRRAALRAVTRAVGEMEAVL